MNNVMTDLETLGVAPGCVVLSIGAVKFDGVGVGDKFHVVINRESCKQHGLVEDPSTVKWWDEQSVDAKKTLLEADTSSILLPQALDAFSSWFGDAVFIWGNGAGFDQPILAYAYNAWGKKPPWKFYNERCHRTYKSLAPDIEVPRVGVYHNAQDDAESQALQAIKVFKRLGVGL